MEFPIDLSAFTPQKFDLNQPELSAEQLAVLEKNIQLARDAIIFFTAFANVKGLGGHTGGAYDIVPELLIVDAFMKGTSTIHPVFFDEAGHRVAIQYLMAVVNGFRPQQSLLHYREYDHGLYGHPERDDAGGIFFSSGRLGHLWSYVNGVAEADRTRTLVMFGSDGSQMEGDNAEAARYAVARQLQVKLFIDDNDVTIAGHPSRYLRGYDVVRTLEGHGLPVSSGDGEQPAALYRRIQKALSSSGPAAVVSRRPMAPQVEGIEGTPAGHDVIAVDLAINYLKARGLDAAVEILEAGGAKKSRRTYLGSDGTTAKVRDDFGRVVCEILKELATPEEKVLVVDSDLEGSCGLHHIRKNFPQCYVHGGIMERNNYSVAAGFGSKSGRQGIFGTFAAFLEMVISEITMARLNDANVLAHFSHSGIDDMADNTCHFGINNFFADNALEEGDRTRLYFPADTNQLRAIVKKVFHDEGLRFLFSTRSATPCLLDSAGEMLYGDDYRFEPGRDEVVRNGREGWVVSYGEMVYRALDAVEQLRSEGHDIGLINKPTLNVVDEEMITKAGAAPFVLIVESQNRKTGLACRYGSWLLERGLTPRFAGMGTARIGHGGIAEQVPHQGLAVEDIKKKILAMKG